MIERRIMIVPIGLEKERIIEGFRKYPVNVVYFLHNLKYNEINEHKVEKQSKSISGVHNYSEKFYNKINQEYNWEFLERHDESIKLNSFTASISKLIEIYEQETKKSNFTHIYLNTSTASKVFAIAAYIFACYHQGKCTPFYLDTDKYILLNHLDEDPSINELKEHFLKSGLTSGPYNVQELPLIPIQKLNEYEINLAVKLIKKKSYISMKSFFTENKMEYTPSSRIKAKRAFEKFQNLKLVILEKQGREISIDVSPNLKNILSFQT